MAAPSLNNGWPLGPGVRVLAGDSHGLLAFDKPCGVRTHPNDAKPDARSLLRAPYDPVREAYTWTDAGGQSRHLFLINRLDAPTSGLVLGCSLEKWVEPARAAFEEGRVEKRYLALVVGVPTRREAVWQDRLVRERDRRGGWTVRVARAGEKTPGAGAVTQVTAIDMDRRGWGIALLDLRPATGRTHQLRVQCAARRLPILGDATYGDFRRNRELIRRTGCGARLMLHAADLRIVLGSGAGGTPFEAHAPIPPEFSAAFGGALSLPPFSR